MASARLLKEDKETLISRTKFATLYMAAPLVLSFLLIDYFFRPDLVEIFFKIRLTVIPISIFAFYLYKIPIIRERFFYIPTHIMSLYLGVYTTALIMLSGGVHSSYYAGLNLAVIGSISWFPFSTPQMFVSIGTIYLPYFILLAVTQGYKELSVLIPNLAFIFSTIFIAFTTNLLMRRLRRIEGVSRSKLERELETKEMIIQKKTKEGVYLEKLMAQFSPQVIEEIKSEKIDLEAKVRKEITCIFIDIVNSSKQSVRLDHYEYTSIISSFFSECIEILLKNNVTVGTYLGDGIMAFSNAPKSSSQHTRDAFYACLGILSLYNDKNKYYSNLWKNEFNIRIGLNVGYSSVGFFPGVKRGTYTAIGEVVNLTSRLCSVAPENSICLTKRILLELSQDLEDLQVSKMEENTFLKGFEEDKIELFSVKSKIGPKLRSDEDRCPLCSDKMVIVSTFDNCNLIKCVGCNYSDIQEFNEKASDEKAS